MPVVSQQHDQIHADLYDKVNECTAACCALKSEISTLKEAMTSETDRYVELLHRAQDKQFRIAGCLFLALVFCIGIIGYGAIGQKGMYTVRDTSPIGRQTAVTPYMLPAGDRDIFTPHGAGAQKKPLSGGGHP